MEHAPPCDSSFSRELVPPTRRSHQNTVVAMSAILTTPGCGDRPVCSGIRGPCNKRPLIDQGHTCICACRRVEDLERQFRVIHLEQLCNIVFGKHLRYSAKIMDRFIRMGIAQSPILGDILHLSIKKGGYPPVTNKWVPPPMSPIFKTRGSATSQDREAREGVQ